MYFKQLMSRSRRCHSFEAFTLITMSLFHLRWNEVDGDEGGMPDFSRIAEMWRQSDVKRTADWRAMSIGHGWVVTWRTGARDRYQWHAPSAYTCHSAKYACHSGQSIKWVQVRTCQYARASFCRSDMCKSRAWADPSNRHSLLYFYIHFHSP